MPPRFVHRWNRWPLAFAVAWACVVAACPTPKARAAPTLAPSGAANGRVPEPLKPWVDWVLADANEAGCPTVSVSANVDNQTHVERCVWPSRLELTVDDRGARFAQRWHVSTTRLPWASASALTFWVPLPGDSQRWPLDVTVDNRPAAVIAPDASRRLVTVRAWVPCAVVAMAVHWPHETSSEIINGASE